MLSNLKNHFSGIIHTPATVLPMVPFQGGAEQAEEKTIRRKTW
jgi:hypothetical protein